MKQKGITLIALVITIIVLLILAGVSISLVTGENGVLSKAKMAVEKNTEAKAKEDINMAWASCETAYRTAWAMDTGVERSSYYTKEAMNKDLADSGTVTSLNYNENGESEVTYQTKSGTTYTMKISATGEVTTGTGTTTVTPSTPTININGTSITKDNFGQYLGKKVSYVPSNTGTNTSYGTSATYRIFYIDFDNKYGDGDGTIYLKADEDGKNVSLSSYTGYSSTDNYVAMKKLNPSWVKPDTLQTNDKCVSWICDPNKWTAWQDTTTTSVKDNINYVVGSPSLEMYVDSYNAYLDSHTGLMKNGGTNPAEKLACEYVTSGYNAKGYRIGFLSTDKANWANTGYYQAENSLIQASTIADKMYNPGSSRYYWLASPSSNYSIGVMIVSGDYSRVYYDYYNSNDAFCPLVSLKSAVQLTIVNE